MAAENTDYSNDICLRISPNSGKIIVWFHKWTELGVNTHTIYNKKQHEYRTNTHRRVYWLQRFLGGIIILPELIEALRYVVCQRAFLLPCLWAAGKEKNLSREELPVWEKYLLTVEEAAQYFQIGETKLRRLMEQNPDEAYILINGNRKLIKRHLFEDYLDQCSVIWKLLLAKEPWIW